MATLEMSSSTQTSNTPSDETEFISGIDLARMFYIEVVHPLIEGRTHSAARLGSGSEVLGFDTPRSTDHGWGPRLHIFVAASEVDAVRTIIDSSLPAEFHGWPVYFGWDEVAVQHHVHVALLGQWLESHLGFDPQVDITVHNWLTTPQQLLLDVFFVGVHCPLPELERREFERGNRRVGEARWDYQIIHSFAEYDLEIDSMQPNQINVSTLVDAWKSRQSPSAFERMAARK